jgi:glucose/arabinose dehydrogenase
MMVYDGDVFPEWKGDVFVGSLTARHLTRVRFEGTRAVEEERLLVERGERIRAVVNGPDGMIYLLTDAPDGALLRVEPGTPADSG